MGGGAAAARRSALLALAQLAVGCGGKEAPPSEHRHHVVTVSAPLAGEASPLGSLSITYPQSGAQFPADILPPTIGWDDRTPGVSRWAVAVTLDGERVLAETTTRRRSWRPTPAQWAAIKAAASGKSAAINVYGFGDGADEPRSRAKVVVGLSTDAVAAPILYRDVILPFKTARQHKRQIRWRLGRVDSPGEPPIVMKDIPICANCHTVSTDGSTYGMNVHFEGTERAGYAIAPTAPEVVLDGGKAVYWSRLKRDDPTYRTAALLTALSPDGRYAVSTGEDMTTILDAPENLAYSFAAFFTFRGVLVVNDTKTGKFWVLPGADDREYVHTNPTWSPDGSYIVFTRAKALRIPGADTQSDPFYKDERAIEQAVARQGGFRYDLYRIPFNGGQGGKARPVAGASNNGMSNFFPAISPNGKWLVFTKAKHFNLLQPDSRLYIVSTAGGTPREMTCNTPEFNSWHSWSPNSRWLVFSSKARGPYTQLYLTHVDDEGRDSPAVLLENLVIPNRAANIPVFANVQPGQLARLRLVQ